LLITPLLSLLSAGNSAASASIPGVGSVTLAMERDGAPVACPLAESEPDVPCEASEASTEISATETLRVDNPLSLSSPDISRWYKGRLYATLRMSRAIAP